VAGASWTPIAMSRTETRRDNAMYVLNFNTSESDDVLKLLCRPAASKDIGWITPVGALGWIDAQVAATMLILLKLNLFAI
jgi:hypothetical protein